MKSRPVCSAPDRDRRWTGRVIPYHLRPVRRCPSDLSASVRQTLSVRSAPASVCQTVSRQLGCVGLLIWRPPSLTGCHVSGWQTEGPRRCPSPPPWRPLLYRSRVSVGASLSRQHRHVSYSANGGSDAMLGQVWPWHVSHVL